jgi:hypothetical protein
VADVETAPAPEKDKWLEAVIQMTKLTNDGIMLWQKVPLASVSLEQSADDRVEGIYRSEYKGNIYRLHKKVVRKVPNPLSWYVRTGTIFGSEPDRDFREAVILELIDDEGASLWTFPHVAGLRDLYTAAQRQVANPENVLTSLFEPVSDPVSDKARVPASKEDTLDNGSVR